MAKKFGERALNSTTYMDETITKALEETAPVSHVVQPVPAAPVEEETPTATKAELSPAVETNTAKEPEESRVGEEKPKKTTRKSSGKVAEPEVEKTIGLNLAMPKSMYKRLSNMKLDMDGESLKSLGLTAIEQFLKKKGY